jgi:hypothetical protein
LYSDGSKDKAQHKVNEIARNTTKENLISDEKLQHLRPNRD